MTLAGIVCSGCKGPNDRRPQRYCTFCHALAMRRFRSVTPLTPEQRFKMNARSYANVYQRRGLLHVEPCEVPGCTTPAEKHHDDYTKPLRVRWMCREHHLHHHQIEANHE